MNLGPSRHADRRAMSPQAAPAPQQGSLRLHIDRIVLNQLPLHRSEQGPVRAAVVAELELLFGTGALRPELRQGFSTPGLRLGDIRLRDGGSPEQIGLQIAQALYREFGR